VTYRALGVFASGAALIPVGFALGWPELSGLGACAAVLVILALLGWGTRPQVDVSVDGRALRVVRGEPATVRVEVSSSRRRPRLRLVEGPVALPRRSLPIKPGVVDTAVAVPVDTTRRGEWPVGPFSAVRSDPWSFVRRVAGASGQTTILVRPKVHPVRKGFVATAREGSTESSSRQRGEDHFFALREYVLGDEPRMVHWRSSARSGKLVVKQFVASAAEGTLIVLDTDASAYGSETAFGNSFVEERFERAVEIAASLCAARSVGVARVQLATTTRGAPVQTAGASGTPQALVDALAVVRAVPPLDTAPADLIGIVRRTRCSTVVVVTGTPSPALMAGAGSAVIIRVGSGDGSLRGRIIDVTSAEDLA
jgi:uncharacterized protein (DUF58 family)